jgi:hypothetical protein
VTLGHRGRKRDPLYRIRKLLLTAAEQLTSPGRARLRAGLAAGDPFREVTAAWQGKELLRAVYAAADLAAARIALDRFYRWADGVGVAELSRLARTVRAWQTEILAWHQTTGCSNGPTEAINLLIKKVTSPRHGWDEVRRRPGLLDPPLWRPLVVVGLPRTGTTLLQSLLGCDPQALVLPFWQLRRPYPIPRRRLDPATRTLRAAPWPGWARSVASRLGDIHPVDQASVMAGSTVGLPTGRDHQRRRRGYGSLIASSPCDRRHQVAVVKSCGPWLPHSGGNGMGLALPRRLRARIPPPRATTICRPTPAIA